MKKVYFIVNPQAKNGKCKNLWIKLEKKLANTNIDYQVIYTEYAKHATKIARDIVSQDDNSQKLIVAVGGDGTIQEIVSGFSIPIPSNLSISYIPCGSANDFSLGFGVDKNPFKAMDQLIKNLETKGVFIDLGKVKGDNISNNFINNMGIGYDAQICKSVNESKIKFILNKIGLGKFVYVYFLIKHLLTYETTTFEIKVDDQLHTFEDGWFCSISNQPYYGGGMRISPLAQVNDGLLNITMVNKISRWKILTLFITVFWGGHTNFKEIHMYEGKNITVKTKQNLPIHVDGEVVGSGNVDIQVCHKAIHFIGTKQD